MPSHPLLERPPFEKLRGDVWSSLVLTEVVDREDVRVIESACGPRLLLESPKAIRICSCGSRKNLHSNVAMENFVMGAVHHAHPARTYLLDDAVVGERVPISESTGPPW